MDELIKKILETSAKYMSSNDSRTFINLFDEFPKAKEVINVIVSFMLLTFIMFLSLSKKLKILNNPEKVRDYVLMCIVFKVLDDHLEYDGKDIINEVRNTVPPIPEGGTLFNDFLNLSRSLINDLEKGGKDMLDIVVMLPTVLKTVTFIPLSLNIFADVCQIQYKDLESEDYKSLESDVVNVVIGDNVDRLVRIKGMNATYNLIKSLPFIIDNGEILEVENEKEKGN